MAIIRKNILGTASGRVGDYVYRTRNGKLVKYRRPLNQKVSRSAAAESARKDFSIVVKFASCINNSVYLKEIWRQSTVPGSTHYQKMIKYNSHNVKQSGISVNSVITPPGIPFNIKELALKPSDISFIVTECSLKLKKLFSVPGLIHLVFYFYSPKLKSKKAYSFGGMTVPNDHTAQQTGYKFNIKLSREIASSIKLHKGILIFISASMLNPGNTKVYWSSTFSEDTSIQN